MKNTRMIVAILCFTATSFGVMAQERKAADDVPTVPYCDLVREPASYDQRIVRVKVTYIVGFEGSIMYDLSCGRKDSWVELDPVAETSTDPEVLKRFRRLADARPERARGGVVNHPVRRVEVVWVGRFDGIRPTQKIGERTLSFGFGHLNSFAYQFNVQRIEQVSPCLRMPLGN